jgi:hypothetical protein
MAGTWIILLFSSIFAIAFLVRTFKGNRPKGIQPSRADGREAFAGFMLEYERKQRQRATQYAHVGPDHQPYGSTQRRL